MLQAVEQTFDFRVIWDAMTGMWRHSNELRGSFWREVKEDMFVKAVICHYVEFAICLAFTKYSSYH